MTRDAFSDVEARDSDAARRFVSVDSGGEPAAEAELASWLAEQPANERALQRVELAVELGRRLAAEPASVLHAEARRAAQARPRRAPLARPLVWGGALAALLLAALYVVRDYTTSAPDTVVLPAARTVAIDAPSNPVAVLPGGVVVDAGAVAVLPFAVRGDGALAASLEQDVARALRTVPGLYVIADSAVRPYAASELGAAEIGGLLGARGLVDAAVEVVDGRVLVSARLREAATGAILWQTQLERPVAELRVIRSEIADSIAAAMLDPRWREPAVGTDSPDEPAAAKPFQQ